MRNIIVTLMAGLLIMQIPRAQGAITYISNLGDTSSGNSAIGNNSWFAADFITGTNTGGYLLDSVQLALANASGSPSGFTVMVYALGGNGTIALPGNSIGTLSGLTDPSTAGIYTYAPASQLTLSPSTYYFVVLTSGTAVANSAYEWNVTSMPSPGYNSYHWGGEVILFQSRNGSTWTEASGMYGQFALTAEPIPEPSTSFLLLLASGIFIYVRRTFHR